MKKLLILAIVACLPVLAKAQENRWMFLADSEDNLICFVDTLKENIKQYNHFDHRNNIVNFWVKVLDTSPKKNGSYGNFQMIDYATDTTNRQIKILSYVKYKNNKPIPSDHYYEEWIDVVPDSMGEDILKYAKSLNNVYIRAELLYNASLNNNTRIKHKNYNR